MNFIEELYYGNINPNEKRYDGHTDYAKAMRRFCNSENELNKMLKEIERKAMKLEEDNELYKLSDNI